MISILTLNAALLGISFTAGLTFSLQPHSFKRTNELAKFLTDESTEIITLQEIAPEFQKIIIKTTIDIYPYHSTENSGGIFKSELLTLSKNPIINTEVISFTANAVLESIGIRKGMLITDTTIHNVPITLINTHLVASGLFKGQESKKIIKIRSKQIKQIIDTVSTILSESPEKLVIVAGDFNTGPEVAIENYKELLEYFDDTFILDPTPPKNKYSWLPVTEKSDFFSKLFFRSSNAQRIDGIFIPKSQILLYNKLFNKTEVEITDNSISDHKSVELTTK